MLISFSFVSLDSTETIVTFFPRVFSRFILGHGATCDSTDPKHVQSHQLTFLYIVFIFKIRPPVLAKTAETTGQTTKEKKQNEL